MARKGKTMKAARIKELRAELDAERISYEELSEIEEAFALIPDWLLRDERENATASDMLDEIETHNAESEAIEQETFLIQLANRPKH